MRIRRLMVVVGGCGALLLAGKWLAADTLVLRNGNTVEGELVSADRDTIEFREKGLFGLGQVRRFDRDDVRRIEIERSAPRDRETDRDRGDDRGRGTADRDQDRGRGTADRDRDRSSDRDSGRDAGRSGDRDAGRDVGRGRPSGLRERSVDVAANVAWTDAGVEVRAGQEVYFDPSGKITWGPGRRDDAGGEGGNHVNAGRPIPRRPGAALIGKVGGNSRDYFFIGNEKGPIRMPSAGRLFVGINDDYLLDNSGGFRVTVYY